MWPTPNVPNGGRVTLRKGREGGNLIEAVSNRETWPTPSARDWKSHHNENARPLNEVVGGMLNPRWVSWLMGWPVSWCELSPMSREEMGAWMEMTMNGGWFQEEPPDVPRTVKSAPRRVDKLKALGNGQVPFCAATAFRLLMERLQERIRDGRKDS